MKRKVVTAILIYLLFGLSLHIYTDLRGYDHGLFHYVDMLFPFGDLSFQYASDFVLYNLPDGLWFLSMLLLLSMIWEPSGKQLWVWSGMALVVAYAIEFAEYFHFLPGTFDWMDIIVYTFTFFLFHFFYFINFQKTVVMNNFFKHLLSLSAVILFFVLGVSCYQFGAINCEDKVYQDTQPREESSGDIVTRLVVLDKQTGEPIPALKIFLHAYANRCIPSDTCANRCFMKTETKAWNTSVTQSNGMYTKTMTSWDSFDEKDRLVLEYYIDDPQNIYEGKSYSRTYSVDESLIMNTTTLLKKSSL